MVFSLYDRKKSGLDCVTNNSTVYVVVLNFPLNVNPGKEIGGPNETKNI